MQYYLDFFEPGELHWSLRLQWQNLNFLTVDICSSKITRKWIVRKWAVGRAEREGSLAGVLCSLPRVHHHTPCGKKKRGVPLGVPGLGGAKGCWLDRPGPVSPHPHPPNPTPQTRCGWAGSGALKQAQGHVQVGQIHKGGKKCPSERHAGYTLLIVEPPSCERITSVGQPHQH